MKNTDKNYSELIIVFLFFWYFFFNQTTAHFKKRFLQSSNVVFFSTGKREVGKGLFHVLKKQLVGITLNPQRCLRAPVWKSRPTQSPSTTRRSPWCPRVVLEEKHWLEYVANSLFRVGQASLFSVYIHFSVTACCRVQAPLCCPLILTGNALQWKSGAQRPSVVQSYHCNKGMLKVQTLQNRCDTQKSSCLSRMRPSSPLKFSQASPNCTHSLISVLLLCQIFFDQGS